MRDLLLRPGCNACVCVQIAPPNSLPPQIPWFCSGWGGNWPVAKLIDTNFGSEKGSRDVESEIVSHFPEARGRFIFLGLELRNLGYLHENCKFEENFPGINWTKREVNNKQKYSMHTFLLLKLMSHQSSFPAYINRLYDFCPTPSRFHYVRRITGEEVKRAAIRSLSFPPTEH